MFFLEKMDTVSSTNDVVKAAIREGQPEGFAVVAREQTGGYGRQGRAWASPPGGMYLSVLLRPQVPPEHISALSLGVGMAVRNALASLVLAADVHDASADGTAERAQVADALRSAAEDIMVKWPNDVVFGSGVPFRKLCGISLELIDGAVCVGIGVNVLPSQDRAAEQLGHAKRNQPISVSELLDSALDGSGSIQSPSVERVCDEVLRDLEIIYTRWLRDGFRSLRGEYEAHSALHGQFVAIEARNGSLIAEGEVLGIDENGNLILRNSDDGAVCVSSGEAHVKVVR